MKYLMKKIVRSLNWLYSMRADNDPNCGIYYWCNSCGDINIPGEPKCRCGCENDLPKEVRRLYDTYQTELEAFRVYTVSVCGVPGMAFNILLDDGWVNDVLDANPELKAMFDSDDGLALRTAYGRALAKKIATYVPAGCEVFYGDYTDPDGDEILVFIPGTIVDRVSMKNMMTDVEEIMDIYPIEAFFKNQADL